MERPASGYLLCGTPRTGSTLLCSLLSSTGVLGRPRSWFREPDEAALAQELGEPIVDGRPADYERYVHAVSSAGRTPNGRFAARIMWGSVEHVVDRLGGAPGRPDLETLEAALGRLAVVHLSRMDVAGQAVSWCRAEQTGYWQQGDRAQGRPTYDLDRLLNLVRTIQEHEAAWRAWFDQNRIRPVELTYEDLVDDPAAAVLTVADRLGVDLPVAWRPRPVETRQADDLSQEWADQLRAALGHPGRPT